MQKEITKIQISVIKSKPNKIKITDSKRVVIVTQEKKVVCAKDLFPLFDNGIYVEYLDPKEETENSEGDEESKPLDELSKDCLDLVKTIISKVNETTKTQREKEAAITIAEQKENHGN